MTTKNGTSLINESVNTLIQACHGLAKSRGWWNKERPVPELLCLIHSEVSEALEGYRKDEMDQHLPDLKSLDVELADVVIRVFDMAGGLGIDLANAVEKKLAYNAVRSDHSLENRMKEGGKKI